MIENEKNIGEWVSVLWNIAQGGVHPDDQAFAARIYPAGGVFILKGFADDFAVLSDGVTSLRARPLTSLVLPQAPRFELGDAVKVTGDSHTPFTGQVRTRMWHRRKERYFYVLWGKSKRYFDEDLCRAGDSVHLRDTVEKIAAEIDTSRPTVLVALWDGDTRGWCLFASVRYANEHGNLWSEVLRFGGDIRFFEGKMCPPPEAVFVQKLASELQARFGTRLYFPAPEKPDDEHPSWEEYNAVTFTSG